MIDDRNEAASSPLLAALLAELRGDDEARRDLAELLAPRAPEPLLTCSQAAKRAGVHVETIRRAVRDGKLRAGYVGPSPRIAPADLETWLSGDRRQRPSSQPRGRRSNGNRPLAGALANLDK